LLDHEVDEFAEELGLFGGFGENFADDATAA
jgi:hypothetical protein